MYYSLAFDMRVGWSLDISDYPTVSFGFEFVPCSCVVIEVDVHGFGEVGV